MSNHIYSTLTCDQRYTGYAKGGADLPVVAWEVLIKGGSNVADKRLITPIGVRTEVTDEQLAQLLENPVFKLHVNNGFITVEDVKEDPEKVAADMATKDDSAPLTPEDIAKQNEEAEMAGQAVATVSSDKSSKSPKSKG